MIKVNHVTKAYGDQVAVNNLCFHIKEGETVGLLGPNGAGKSTTMNLLTGLIEPSEGEIQICGYDLLKDPKHAKAQIGRSKNCTRRGTGKASRHSYNR